MSNCQKFELDLTHPTFAVCKCGLHKNEHDPDALMNTSIPRRRTRMMKKKKKKMSKPKYDLDMSSLPDLSGIRRSSNYEDDDLDVSNISLSEDSQEEETTTTTTTTHLKSRRSSAMLNSFLDDIQFDNDDDEQQGLPPLPPRNTKPAKPPRSTKPIKPPKSSKPKLKKPQEITSEALDSFFEDVDRTSTSISRRYSNEDIMETLAKEGRREMSGREVDDNSGDWIDSMFSEEEEDEIVRRKIETIEPPPGVDPFVFASLPYALSLSLSLDSLDTYPHSTHTHTIDTKCKKNKEKSTKGNVEIVNLQSALRRKNKRTHPPNQENQSFNKG